MRSEQALTEYPITNSFWTKVARYGTPARRSYEESIRKLAPMPNNSCFLNGHGTPGSIAGGSPSIESMIGPSQEYNEYKSCKADSGPQRYVSAEIRCIAWNVSARRI